MIRRFLRDVDGSYAIATIAALVPIIGGIWLLVELGILEGSRGPNRFGPDPLA